MRPAVPNDVDHGDEAGGTDVDPSRFDERTAFWKEVLAVMASRSSLFSGRLTPGSDNWLSVGAGKTGVSYAFVVTRDGTRAELTINTGWRVQNKAMFDQLLEQRAAIEDDFGGPLEWQRLDDKATCRIASSLSLGGWGDRSTWPAAIPSTVELMVRLHRALHGRVADLVAPPAPSGDA